MTDIDMPCWLVCRCNPQRMTRSVRSRLTALGAEFYMATHHVLLRRGGAMVEAEESLIGHFFFVRLTLRTALKFKFDNALDYTYARDGRKQLLVVPDAQMENFRRMVDTMPGRIDFTADPLAVGDHVVVTRGPLAGVEGVLQQVDGSSHLVVSVAGVLAVSVKIGRSSVRRLKAPQAR